MNGMAIKLATALQPHWKTQEKNTSAWTARIVYYLLLNFSTTIVLVHNNKLVRGWDAIYSPHNIIR